MSADKLRNHPEINLLLWKISRAITISNSLHLKISKKTLLGWLKSSKNAKKSLKNKSLKKYKPSQNIIKINKSLKEPTKTSSIKLNKS